MSMDKCAWCSGEVTDDDVRYRKRLFCSDECCDEYQDDLTTNGEPNPEELEQEFSAEDIEDIGFADEEDEDPLENDGLDCGGDDF